MDSVGPHIIILRTIGNKKLSSNQLWRATGLEKSSYRVNRQELKHLDFVLEESDPKSIQKDIYFLSDLGKSVAELIEEANLFHDAYVKLLNGMIEKVLLEGIMENPLLLSSKLEGLNDQDKKKRNKLQFQMRSLGCTNEEIIFNQECVRNLIDLKHVCEVNFFFTLMFRFRIIKLKFLSTGKWKKKENQKEDLIKDILFQLLKDKMLTILDFVKYRNLSQYEFTSYGYMILYDEKMDYQIKNRIHGGVFNLLYDMIRIFAHPLPFVLKAEIEEVTKSYFSMISPLFLEKIKKSKPFKMVFNEFNDDIEEEKRNLSKMPKLKNIAKKEIQSMILTGKINIFDYYMTNRNDRDYKKLQIRSMELLQKLTKI